MNAAHDCGSKPTCSTAAGGCTESALIWRCISRSFSGYECYDSGGQYRTLFATHYHGLATEAAVPAVAGQHTDLPRAASLQGEPPSTSGLGGLVTVAHTASTVTAEGGFELLHTLRSGPAPDGICVAAGRQHAGCRGPQ
ncbi:hypothetical protein Vafri_17975 [Volvox africanus]|uniref:Uncharacterized protein n=1 Tax=Volvox africanus TaxID=51714 RepID=A0A8J4FAR4_9CHLO|nr:hypothetical protein Vafri_17975 [Volvox africanus]